MDVDLRGRHRRPDAGRGLGETAFPTQSDAESWFGEVWHDLSAAGVAAVTLHRDGQKVYGPMSLAGPS